MYQVLLVDDEYLARGKLECIISWEDYGFCIAGSAENGIEAVDFLKETPVDVIFADVCMPMMNGVELTKYVKEHFPDTAVVIMSSYSDFSYVRECFTADAFDYVLKHTITADSLALILEKLKKTRLINKNDSSSESFNAYKQMQAYRKNMQSAILGKTILKDVPSSLVATAKLKNYSLMRQTHTNEEMESYYQHITNTMAKILKDVKGITIFQDNCERFVLFIPFGDVSETTVMNVLKEYIQKISYCIKKFFDLSLLWGFSCMSTETYTPHMCYLEAVNMLEQSPVKDKSDNAKNFSFSSLSMKNERDIITAVSAMDFSSIDRALLNIFEELPQDSLAINIIVGELINMANKICNELSINLDAISANLCEFNSMTKNKHTKEEFFLWVKNLYHAIANEYIEKSSDNSKPLYSAAAKKYIAEHYGENLSLKQIALSIGITEPYLSTVFKKETGETISKYLTVYRIEKAQELLKNDVDIKLLYSLVGFQNYNYFFVAFKKIAGCTPIQFKKRCVKD